jgi:hypothetical protein
MSEAIGRLERGCVRRKKAGKVEIWIGRENGGRSYGTPQETYADFVKLA